MTTCARCRAVAPEPVPLTWTSATESGRLRHYCAPCSREHLRAMEARLEPEWW